MNSMTFQKEGDYIVCYVNGKEMNRSKLSKAGETEQDVIDTINEQIKANPTLAGTESGLNGLEVDGTKYKVGGGSEVHLYQHILGISMTYRSFGPVSYFNLILQSDSSAPITLNYIRDTLGYNSPDNKLVISCLDTDKIYTSEIYINDDVRIIGYGINLDTWSSFTSKVTLLGSYAITDKVTQIL